MISPEEIASLWRAHASGLALLVRAWCDADVDDLVQEAFIRLARQPVVPNDPQAWLAKTARNLAIDQVRSNQRRRKREQAVYETKDPWFLSAATSETTALELTVSLQSLSDEEREIVVAHVWNGMSFRQIAEAFELSSSTANRRYQRALVKLRQSLGVEVTDCFHRGLENEHE